MFKKKKLIAVLACSVLTGNVLYAWGPPHPPSGAGAFVAGAAVGAAVTYGVMSHKKKRRVHKKRHARKKHVKKYVAPVMTIEKKIQKSLTALGFYHGKIDGEVNSYETRSAIKAMNNAYGLGNTASLDPKTRDALVYLGDLFIFDRYLIAQGSNEKVKAKRIQTALKIYGFYHDKIDGVIGSGTKKIIADYKASKRLSYGPELNFEEEYQLITSAKQLNDKNIDETIASLKSTAPQKAVLSQQKVNSAEGLQNNTAVNANVPQPAVVSPLVTTMSQQQPANNAVSRNTAPVVNQ